jgi:hypothetical protein
LNARFEGPEPVRPEDLERWMRWHDVRLALGAIAAVATASTLNHRPIRD